MQHRVIERIDALEILRIERVLGTDPRSGLGAEIGLEQPQHRPENRPTGQPGSRHWSSSRSHQLLLEQRVENDAWRSVNLRQHPIELLLGAHQRVDVLDRLTFVYWAVAARATVVSVSPVASETRCRWK